MIESPDHNRNKQKNIGKIVGISKQKQNFERIKIASLRENSFNPKSLIDKRENK